VRVPGPRPLRPASDPQAGARHPPGCCSTPLWETSPSGQPDDFDRYVEEYGSRRRTSRPRHPLSTREIRWRRFFDPGLSHYGTKQHAISCICRRLGMAPGGVEPPHADSKAADRSMICRGKSLNVQRARHGARHPRSECRLPATSAPLRAGPALVEACPVTPGGSAVPTGREIRSHSPDAGPPARGDERLALSQVAVTADPAKGRERERALRFSLASQAAARVR
jgi:hypothetical protein